VFVHEGLHTQDNGKRRKTKQRIIRNIKIKRGKKIFFWGENNHLRHDGTMKTDTDLPGLLKRKKKEDLP
jgi:hypothetical protein